MMKRTGTPWMPADDFGRSLTGLGHNLLVTEVSAMTDFLTKVLEAGVVYQDVDFAVLTVSGGTMLLHADHTYCEHPYIAAVRDTPARGAGLEIRLYGVDPDKAEATAREFGYSVLDACTNKPHGLREVYLLGPDAYCFVPSRPLPPTAES